MPSFQLLRFIHQHAAFQFIISVLLVIIGVLLSDSSLSEARSEMFCALTILPVIILFIYAIAMGVVMTSFPFPSWADLFRFSAHVALGFLISTLLEEFYVRLAAVILWLSIYNADTILAQYTSIADFLRSIPRHEGFGHSMEELTRMVQRRFPNSSPLEEDSARAWTFMASRGIYGYTGDVISGSLACAILISFLISRHEMPIYVFLIWAILVFSYLKNNRATIPGNDSDSTSI
ncbi:uncharacterized protein LOC114711767 [Neltuma alba]|uniref:uncharacterized protein LOC114711767 n=1 Tax=Neltuma alba TaxID=207710 RepID=UPI0010A54137|nr:uncharacterized protein LOC114711767 [Prosopis alba]